MFRIPYTIFTEYVAYLKSKTLSQAHYGEYKKWLRYYLDFCDKYPLPDGKADRAHLFCEKLKGKNQSEGLRERAAHAVSLHFEMLAGKPAPQVDVAVEAGDCSISVAGAVAPARRREMSAENDGPPKTAEKGDGTRSADAPTDRLCGQAAHYVSEEGPAYSTYASRRSPYTDAGYQERSASPEWDRVLSAMASEIKVRHYSRNTTKTYGKWSRCFQRFLKNKTPDEVNTEDERAYLTLLAVKCHVAASTPGISFRLKAEDRRLKERRKAGR